MLNFFKKKNLKVPQVSISNISREIGNNPFVDWIVVLIASATVAIILSLGGIYLYYQITSGNIVKKNIKAVKIKTAKIFEEKDLTSIIDRFDYKEQLTKKTKDNFSAPPDPSI